MRYVHSQLMLICCEVCTVQLFAYLVCYIFFIVFIVYL